MTALSAGFLDCPKSRRAGGSSKQVKSGDMRFAGLANLPLQAGLKRLFECAKKGAGRGGKTAAFEG